MHYLIMVEEVITGRSVLSMPNKIGGFRLRYGRACNTGFASVGLHPVIAEILDHTIAVGTQIKKGEWEKQQPLLIWQHLCQLLTKKYF